MLLRAGKKRETLDWKSVGWFVLTTSLKKVVQGYGLSETCAVTAVSDRSLWGRAAGHVGFPAPENELVLESVPDMNYSVDDLPCPRGEVCQSVCDDLKVLNDKKIFQILIRGPNVFGGYSFALCVKRLFLTFFHRYFREPGKTAEVMTADGFFCTGDIGQWNPDGTLSIIDRKKNIFKLAQGEYIAVEKLEQLYVRSPYVAQIWVYGNSERDVRQEMRKGKEVVSFFVSSVWLLLLFRIPKLCFRGPRPRICGRPVLVPRPRLS